MLIITGGDSSERRISFMSAKQVKDALIQKGYNPTLFDLKKGYEKLKEIAKKYDVVFPVIHGEEGEGGQLHKFLSTLNKPFVGGDWKGSQKGWYKIPFKKYCDKNNILTSPWKEVKNIDQVKKFGFPCVIKTSNGGSSREVLILKSEKDLKSAKFKKLLSLGTPMLVEKYLQGIEVTAGILSDQALPVIEIRPKDGGWFDYKTKYWEEVDEVPFAPSLSPKVQKGIQDIALKIHQNLNLGDYSRIDFIVADNKPYCLEVNTIPGLTATSLFPKAAQAIGTDFPELMSKLVKNAKAR